MKHDHIEKDNEVNDLIRKLEQMNYNILSILGEINKFKQDTNQSIDELRKDYGKLKNINNAIYSQIGSITEDTKKIGTIISDTKEKEKKFRDDIFKAREKESNLIDSVVYLYEEVYKIYLRAEEENKEMNGGKTAYVELCKLVINLISQAFEDCKVTFLIPLWKPYNTSLHECIGIEKTREFQDQTIIKVISPLVMYNNGLYKDKKAQVIVANNK